MDRQHLPTYLRPTLGVCLLTWGLLWASACSLEAWGDTSIFLLLTFKSWRRLEHRIILFNVGKTLLNRELLKLWHNMYEKISLFSFNILIGTSYCCVAVLQFRFCIGLENFSWVANLKENVWFVLFILFLMFIILGYLENFSMDWRTGSVWDVPEIRYRFWEMFKVFTILLKNL